MKGHHGGGDVWMNRHDRSARQACSTSPPETRAATFDARVRPGHDLRDGLRSSRSIPRRASSVWGYQLEPYDVWDLDSASPPVLFPTKSGLAIGEANKGGFWHSVDARTGKRLTKPVAFVYQHRVVPKPGGKAVVTWPAALGGSEWSPVPFSPQALVYVSQASTSPA